MNRLRLFAVIFALAFLMLGVAGYVPAYVHEGKLWGYFAIDSVHNIFHILFGVVGLLAAINLACSRLYFEILGIIYAGAALLGFLFRGNLYLLQMNRPDLVAALIIAIVALYLGFFYHVKHH